jgi:DNA-binding MarR family transcriptional regulator
VDDELISGVSAVAFASRSIERSLEHMTLPQFRVLTLIASSPERASRLAERAAVTPPSLTGILDGLVTKGWVERSNVDGDRRGVTLTITAKGHEAFDEARRATTEALDALFEEVDPKTRAKALQGLTALQTAMRARSDARVHA